MPDQESVQRSTLSTKASPLQKKAFHVWADNVNNVPSPTPCLPARSPHIPPECLPVCFLVSPFHLILKHKKGNFGFCFLDSYRLGPSYWFCRTSAGEPPVMKGPHIIKFEVRSSEFQTHCASSALSLFLYLSHVDTLMLEKVRDDKMLHCRLCHNLCVSHHSLKTAASVYICSYTVQLDAKCRFW